jgi:hypothetical protein
MKRVIVCLAAWQVVGALAAGAAGQAFYLEGQIVGGERGFEVHPLQFIPFDSLPVFYSGTFTFEPGSTGATFELKVGTGLGNWPSSDLFATNNSLSGVVQNDAAGLFVALSSLPEPWITTFELTLDKTTGQGQWRWSEAQQLVCTPTVCAPGVPGSDARATITAFREVPEAEGQIRRQGEWETRRLGAKRTKLTI